MTRLKPHRKRRSYGLQIFIVLLALFFSSTLFQDVFGLRSLIISAFAPGQKAVSLVWQTLTNTPAAIISLASLAEENQKLKSELRYLKPQIMLLEDKALENQSLRRALNFKQNSAFAGKLLTARVIAKSPTPWFSLVIIDQGSLAGISKDLPVITEVGLAGKIIEVSPLSSKIMLLNDLESSVAAIDARSRDFGLVSGQRGQKLQMRYVSSGGDVKVGDKITTATISSFAPAGLLIGTVSSVSKGEHDLFYQIEIAAAVNFNQLEEVFVLR